MNYFVKTHKPGLIYKGPHTFVLNRGKNTGKLLAQPCPNCWVVIADSETTLDRLEVIIDALHTTKRLRPSLIGSVVEYIRIGDFRKTLDLYVRVIGWGDAYTAQLENIRRAKMLLYKYQRAKSDLELAILIHQVKLLKGR